MKEKKANMRGDLKFEGHVRGRNMPLHMLLEFS